MTRLPHVDVEPVDVARLEPIIGRERIVRLRRTAARAATALGSRRILNVNSTADGGGVAELLRGLLCYVRGVGIDVDWIVFEGSPEFFEITKRVHNGLYGSPGDGRGLGARERAAYDEITAANREVVLAAVRPGDIVLVHDPQPAGLIEPLREHGAIVVWRCHVGVDTPNEWSERAWAFLAPYVEQADVHVFSRCEFAPSWLAGERLVAIAPSIDPFTPKNVDLRPSEVRGLLVAAGLVAAEGVTPDARVTRRALVHSSLGPPPAASPLVVQVSRWDRLKDMPGVLRSFVEHVDPALGAHLMLAGPALDGVQDDPEQRQAWRETLDVWRALPVSAQERVHLAAVPMEDVSENALVVNALQRHASVVVQKSLAEGFGLTVAEAMWKSRPVVASAVGGIAEQVVDGETGLLLPDPRDEAACGAAISRLVQEPPEAARMGHNGRERVRDVFLPDRHLAQYARLIESLLGVDGEGEHPSADTSTIRAFPAERTP